MNKKAQLTIYLNEGDMSGDLHLHEVVVRRLLHAHIAGATVVRGLMGYGKHHQVHRKHLLGVSDEEVFVGAVETPDGAYDVAQIRGNAKIAESADIESYAHGISLP